MVEYRVSKYDPALRDEAGAFQGDDWTAISDIGRSFAGKVLTSEEYHRVETAYVSVALAFLKEGGIESVRVEQLEAPTDRPIPVREGSLLAVNDLAEVIAAILREEFWCNLEAGNAFLHFGYDYYLYLGVPHPCPAAEAFASELGLFVEVFDAERA